MRNPVDNIPSEPAPRAILSARAALLNRNTPRPSALLRDLDPSDLGDGEAA